MTIGVVGRKSGMTRIFAEDGSSIAVTVIEAEPNRITQVKSESSDGYSAVQVAVGSKKPNRTSKALAGHFAKANSEAGAFIRELRCGEADIQALTDGEEAISNLDISSFTEGQVVDVTGRSKGKGFQGGVKRWNFSMLDATHGNSISHRSNGSIGQCQTPGRVFKGKKMSGHMGDRMVTTQNLQIVRVDTQRNLLLIKGAVPGAPGGYVIIRPAVKTKEANA